MFTSKPQKGTARERMSFFPFRLFKRKAFSVYVQIHRTGDRTRAPSRIADKPSVSENLEISERSSPFLFLASTPRSLSLFPFRPLSLSPLFPLPRPSISKDVRHLVPLPSRPLQVLPRRPKIARDKRDREPEDVVEGASPHLGFRLGWLHLCTSASALFLYVPGREGREERRS
jgi:hypothetical protein